MGGSAAFVNTDGMDSSRFLRGIIAVNCGWNHKRPRCRSGMSVLSLELSIGYRLVCDWIEVRPP